MIVRTCKCTFEKRKWRYDPDSEYTVEYTLIPHEDEESFDFMRNDDVLDTLDVDEVRELIKVLKTQIGD